MTVLRKKVKVSYELVLIKRVFNVKDIKQVQTYGQFCKYFKVKDFYLGEVNKLKTSCVLSKKNYFIFDSRSLAGR